MTNVDGVAVVHNFKTYIHMANVLFNLTAKLLDFRSSNGKKIPFRKKVGFKLVVRI